MPINLSSLIVGDWKSLLSNLGGTGPDPTSTGGGSTLLVDAEDESVIGVEAGDESVIGAECVLKEVHGREVGAGGLSADVEDWLGLDAAPEGSLIASNETATLREEDGAVAPDTDCLSRFLAAALMCQPHAQGLPADGEKKEPCRHL